MAVVPLKVSAHFFNEVPKGQGPCQQLETVENHASFDVDAREDESLEDVIKRPAAQGGLDLEDALSGNVRRFNGPKLSMKVKDIEEGGVEIMLQGGHLLKFDK